MPEAYDVAVVGAGILGLATAYHAARDGQRVVVLERDPAAQGASVRNFGMVWPIGQPAGPRLERALRSREHWLAVVGAAGLHHRTAGSLHLAYDPDELAVLEEFVANEGGQRGCEVLTRAATLHRSSSVVPDGLLGALWSPTEVNVDPRQVVADLPRWLARRFGVTVRFGATVVAVEPPVISLAAGEAVRADRVVVCSGSVRDLLFPEVLASAPLRLCKLQMLRTVPQPDEGWDLGPMLAAGSTLRHYPAFAGLASVERVRSRLDRERPTMARFHIHVMASQTRCGEVTLGDSHEYGDEVGPFDREEIDDEVLAYARTFLAVPDSRLAERWSGTYLLTTDGAPAVAYAPLPSVRVVTGVGGAGMTIAFGVTEEVWRSFDDPSPPARLPLS